MPRNALAIVADNELYPYHVCGDPNGLAFDHHRDALYVADSRAGTIHQIAGDRMLCVATIDLAGASNRLAALAVTPYGTLYATRLGCGGDGAVYEIDPEGTPRALAQLSPRFRRLGIVYDAHDHVLFLTQYAKGKDGAPVDGSVVELWWMATSRR